MLLRENAGERRAKEASVEEAQANSREEYLQNGWEDVENPLYEQERVKNQMNRFHSSQEVLQHRQCTVCKETWPMKQNLAAESIQCYVCN